MRSRLRPSQRTLAVALAGLLSGAAIMLAAGSMLSPVGDNARTIVKRDLPASAALQEAAAAGTRAQTSFLEILDASGVEQRSAAVTASTKASAQESSAWTTYLRLARNQPGERDLQAAYKIASARAHSLGATLVGSTALTDPAFAANLLAQREASATGVATLRQIDQQLYRSATRRHANAVLAASDRLRSDGILMLLVAAGVLALVTAWVVRNTRRDERRFALATYRRGVDSARSDLETRLQRALEMEQNEDGTFDVVKQALSMVSAGRPTELLLADSSRAHFRQVLTTTETDSQGCQVGAPNQCPAASSGQTRIWTSSTELDTCPYLRNRTDQVWATCVPVSIAGRTTGILHTQDVVAAPAPEDLPAELELVARKAGDRIGVLRLLARTQAQADADPLTGLPNRRSLEDRAHSLLQAGTPFVVAFLDLDHFKNLNDLHGHDTGDRATPALRPGPA